jgi:hypothetical protein
MPNLAGERQCVLSYRHSGVSCERRSRNHPVCAIDLHQRCANEGVLPIRVHQIRRSQPPECLTDGDKVRITRELSQTTP